MTAPSTAPNAAPNAAPSPTAAEGQPRASAPQPASAAGRQTDLAADRLIVFDNVSKFYGEVLGVNRVHLAIPPGITGLVGPNGSGKTTLFNLATGLLRPTRGTVKVLGLSVDQPEELFRQVGYATQFDSFPSGVTGRRFVESWLGLHGYSKAESKARAAEAIERVRLTPAADRKAAGYSKGMRQRIRLAQAIAHHPSVLLLDEPLNGLDPMVRAEMIDLFQELAAGGLHVIISSHVLHEVDMISDQVILLNGGYVVAEGDIRGVRSEMTRHPMQILVRADRPSDLASRMFAADSVVEAKIIEDGEALMIRTRDADAFYLELNRVVLEHGFAIDTVLPADDDVQSVYQYLIGSNGESVQ